MDEWHEGDITMKHVLTLGMVLSMVLVYSGIALAGDMCSYSAQAQKVVAEKAATAPTAATKTTPPTDPEKLRVAQTEQQAKPVSVANK